jgi:hypothetical protein
MAAYIFNQANGTPLNNISPLLWTGADLGNLLVQSSKLQDFLGGIFASRTVYLNQAGSLSATARVTAGANNEYRLILCSSNGTINFGYFFALAGTTGAIRRDNVFVGTYTLPGGHNANTTDTEIKIEKVGSIINFYAGPIGSPALVGVPFNDPSPISGGFSGFWFNGGGFTTPGIISFDNGVAAYAARITWAEAQYQVPTTPTDYSEPLSRGIFRGIERGVA